MLFLKISGILFHILAPVYCNAHLKQRVLALGKYNLLVKYDLVMRVAISLDKVKRSAIQFGWKPVKDLCTVLLDFVDFEIIYN